MSSAAWTVSRARVTRALASVRPWLRPQAWTKEGALTLAAAARRHPRRAAAVLAALLAAVAFPAFLATRGGPPGIVTASVVEGPFELTIAETGTLQALRSVTYASSIQSNQAKIVALVPEGKLVQYESRDDVVDIA